MSTSVNHPRIVSLLLMLLAAPLLSSAKSSWPNEECNAGLTICSTLTKAVLANYLTTTSHDEISGIASKLCGQHFSCNSSEGGSSGLELATLVSDLLQDFSSNHTESDTISPRSLNYIKDIRKDLKKNLLFGRPLRKPKNSEARPECRKCEKKREYCTYYGIGTTVVCTAAWIVGGQITSTGCSLVTLPRSIDCYMNTFFNCYKKDCGLIGL